MTIEKNLAIRVTRHLRTAIGYSTGLGAGFAVISMGALFIGAAIVGLTAAWFSLYRLELYFEAQHGKTAAINPTNSAREMGN